MPVEITWFGHSCFRLKDRDLTVVCDPYDKSLGLTLSRLRADLVTVSHDAPGHNAVDAVKDWRTVIRGPGEYELSGIFITGIPSYHGGKDQENEPNTVFIFEFPDLTVCHLGDLGHVLSETQVEAMPKIDVLLAPVGGRHTLDAPKAAEVISYLEPGLVVPMHYQVEGTPLQLDPVERFLKEMGMPAPEPVGVLKVTRDQLPEETQVILMEAK